MFGRDRELHTYWRKVGILSTVRRVGMREERILSSVQGSGMKERGGILSSVQKVSIRKGGREVF